MLSLVARQCCQEWGRNTCNVLWWKHWWASSGQARVELTNMIQAQRLSNVRLRFGEMCMHTASRMFPFNVKQQKKKKTGLVGESNTLCFGPLCLPCCRHLTWTGVMFWDLFHNFPLDGSQGACLTLLRFSLQSDRLLHLPCPAAVPLTVWPLLWSVLFVSLGRLASRVIHPMAL